MQTHCYPRRLCADRLFRFETGVDQQLMAIVPVPARYRPLLPIVSVEENFRYRRRDLNNTNNAFVTSSSLENSRKCPT